MTVIDLDEFRVTRAAFLPEVCPLTVLPDPYYEPWEYAASRLPQLLECGSLRSTVEALPVLCTERLKSEAEWRRAYVVLAYMAHAYIWGGDEPKEVLLPQICGPFLRVCAQVEIPPVLTCAAANLWNFSCSGNDFSRLDDLQALISFTGTETESWFLTGGVAIEATGAKVVQPLLKALQAVETREYMVIIRGLEALKLCIDDMTALLTRMYERCDPMTFCHRIRPFYAGSKNMATAGLPRGVFYDAGDGKGEWKKFQGGSNGQSSLIQFFDLVLGIEHNDPAKPKRENFHMEARDCMPGPHRRFLQHASKTGSIQELALSGVPASDEQRRLKAAYLAATDALSNFRTKHIQIVTRLITLPSKKTPKGLKGVGTAGTAILPFLKQARDTTAAAGQCQ
ncbi:putative indoleamine 2,3-dioxygenase [Microsporum ferrugineum]